MHRHGKHDARRGETTDSTTRPRRQHYSEITLSGPVEEEEAERREVMVVAVVVVYATRARARGRSYVECNFIPG